MNAAEMAALLASLTGPMQAVGDRIRLAGRRGYEWPRDALEFYNRRLSERTLERFCVASCLAACELQRIVEMQNAMNAGGVALGG